MKQEQIEALRAQVEWKSRQAGASFDDWQTAAEKAYNAIPQLLAEREALLGALRDVIGHSDYTKVRAALALAES